MRNLRPIFLVGFARGGTNLVLNLLRSHPGVCSPRGETQEVFHGKADEPWGVRAAKRLRYLPIRLLQGQDVFAVGVWRERRPLRAASQRWIDAVLYEDKLRALGPTQNRYRTEGREYSADEIAASRLLCKNVNGLVFLSAELARMYPDATFVGLVRDGRAVCEGQARRGAALAAAADRYERGCQRMARDADAIPRYRIFRYEDLVAAPRATLEEIYRFCDLDPAAVEKLRLETTPVLAADGDPRTPRGAGDKRLVWYGWDDFAGHFRADANAHQIARLSEAQRALIAERCKPALERFGYL